MIFVFCFLCKETSKEQCYPNVFVLLSVSIFREIVLDDLMAPGGNPVERLYRVRVFGGLFNLLHKKATLFSNIKNFTDLWGPNLCIFLYQLVGTS